MNKNLKLLVLILAVLLSACGQSDKINARSDRSMYRSMSGIQRNLPAQQKVEFQVSFWSLKQFAENEAEFRDQIHRKTVPEIIELGKENFAAQSAKGNAKFIKYATWDEMIAELVEERKRTELRAGRRDPRDEGNKIHKM
ncbi:MAG: hypothetical protein NZ729_07765 [Methylococcales bacterium]|nr:hypothetical protein [Methylococcales bacterium]